MLIPKDEQQGILESFWTMLRECETVAGNENDVILKHWVSEWYNQYSRITGDVYKPIWENRDD